MIKSNLWFFGCLLLCLLLCFDVGSSSYRSYFCSGDSWYDVNSNTGRIYKSNLDFLLSNLTSNASRPDGFYNLTAGGADSANHTVVYGLFLCRGDVKPRACQECVAAGSYDGLRYCLNYQIVTIWYDGCMLRYSNQPIWSSGADTNVKVTLKNPQNVTDVALLNQVLGNMLPLIANKAAYDLSGKKFGVGEFNYSTSQRIFALAQCTPDLLSSECAACLRTGISLLPTYAKGGRILFQSCNIRYEMYQFYEIDTPPPDPRSILGPPLGSASDHGKISTTSIVAIAVPIFLAIVLFVVVFSKARGSRKTDHDSKSEISVYPTGASSMW